MKSSWQVEHLFATPMVETDLPPSVDLRALCLSVDTVGVMPMPRTIETELVVRHVRALVDRMTTLAGTPGAPSAPVDWAIGMDAVRVAGERSLALPPCWDAFWSALCVLDGDGAMTVADPRLPVTMMEAPTLRLRVARAELYASDVRFILPRRRVLIFPGWLRCTCEAAATPWSLARVSFVAPRGSSA